MGLLGTLLGHATDVTPEETREDLEGILLPDEPVGSLQGRPGPLRVHR